MKGKSRAIPGINIQWPWSALLLTGHKTVETRTYPIPAHYIGAELAIIETPGPHGKNEAGIDKARIIGTIVFESCFEYRTRDQWLQDLKRHCVPPNDALYGFKQGSPKWGWVVRQVRALDCHVPAPSPRGIVFAKVCKLPG